MPAMNSPVGDGVAIVDAHHHLWNLSSGQYPWLQEEYDPKSFFLGEYSDLCKNFLPEDYQQVSRDFRVVATVHVEAERDRSEQVAETKWLHEQYENMACQTRLSRMLG